VYGVVWGLGWKIEGVLSVFEVIGGSNEFKSFHWPHRFPGAHKRDTEQQSSQMSHRIGVDFHVQEEDLPLYMIFI